MSNSILITGGSGYLGRGLIETLLARGSYGRICIYSRGEHRQAQLRAELGDPPRVRWLIGDVRDRDRLERALYGVDHVIHAAALKRIEVGRYNPSEMFRTNIDGTMNVLDAAERAGCESVLLVSSDKACQPISPYGLSKAAAESLVLHYSGRLRTGAVRYGNVAGSTGSVIPTWRAASAQGRRIRITDPECTRFWMSRDEAVEFVLDALSESCVLPLRRELSIPSNLPAFRLGDLAAVMGLYDYDVVGLPEHEKLHETMDGKHFSCEARRLGSAELRMLVASVPE